MRCVIACLAVAAMASALAPPTDVRVEYIRDSKWALTDSPRPRFSWVPQLDAGSTQAGYQVVVSSASGKPLWDSGHVSSPQAVNVEYGATNGLAADTAASVKVKTWDSSGAASDWSAALSFVVGPMAPGDWRGAAWIACDQRGEMNATDPVAARNRFRAEASLPAGAKVAAARLYVAGTGYARAFVNGKLAGPAEARLQPGWTGYRQRVLYTVADVTSSVTAGAGSVVLGLELGNGWADVLPASWNGTKSHGAVPWHRSGAQRKAVAQLVVEMDDGSTSVLVTGAPGAPGVGFDGSSAAPPRGAGALEARRVGTAAPASILASNWTCGGGPRVNDSVYDGETFDAGRQTPGWSKAGWAPSGPVASSWGRAVAAWPFAADVVLSAQAMPAIAVQRTFTGTPNATADPAPGARRWVWDFGQNMAGATRVTPPPGTPAGATFVVQHAEALMHPPYGPQDGTVYVGNLRSARATDTYVHDGSTPSHEFGEATFHGFRYAQLTVTGVPADWEPEASTVVAVHFRTDVAREGSFAAGDAAGMMDAIHHAAAWVQADNLMSVPSDCDQRDERKGWMGDAALSTEAFFFNFDMPAFYSMWVERMHDSQVNPYSPPHGDSVGDTTPLTFGSAPGDPSWQTAYPTAVAQMWLFARDARLTAHLFDPIVRYTEQMTQAAAGGLAKLFHHYGEWVTPPTTYPTSPDQPTQGPKPPPALVSSFNFVSDVDRAALLANAVGNVSYAQKATAQAAALRTAFGAAFWDASIGAFGAGAGNKDGLQVSNALALALGADHAEATLQSLVEDIESTHGGHLTVGISGAKNLFRQLTARGRADLAVGLMLQTDYPSFGFMVRGGEHGYEPATTLWELWTAPVSGPGMNSRAHHMFSAGPELYFYEDVAGIKQCPGSAGMGCVRFAPAVSGVARVPWANATIPTLAGPASVAWVNGTSAAAAIARGGEEARRAASGPVAAPGTFSLTATLPVGGASGQVVVPADPATATIVCNGVTVWEGGKFQHGAKGVTEGAAQAGSVLFSVGPGGEFGFSTAA